MRVVVVGGGVAGLYFASQLLKVVPRALVYVVDPKPVHEFTIGVPIAVAGLVDFRDLAYPFEALRRVVYVKATAAAVEPGCVRTREGPERLCGDYVVLAPGSFKVGKAEYWTVYGAERLLQAAERARAVRFVVNELTPVIGFQEIAYSIKTRFPEKEVSIHLVYIHEDYKVIFDPWRAKAAEAGIHIDEDPPTYRSGELHISVPVARVHPLAFDLEVDPATFETQHERVYLIGDSSLLKLGLPPIGWGSLWQASTLARALAQEVNTGVFEVEAADWATAGGREQFLKWFTYKIMSGTPLAHLKGLFDLWRSSVLKPLSGE
jgi:NADH dehydrogenase FAD-containing subunit